MKRVFSLLLALVLCSACLLAARAEGDMPDTSREAFTSFIYLLRHLNDRMVKSAPKTLNGKGVIAVYYDLDAEPLELSAGRLAADGAYRDIPADLLAASADEADWALLVYPQDVREDEDAVTASVFAADLKTLKFYKPFAPKAKAVTLQNGKQKLDLAGLVNALAKDVLQPALYAARDYDDAYLEALQYLKEGKYYSAYASFRNSYADNADARAEACVQPWPKNGEVWRSSAAKKKNMELTIKVQQDQDRAFLARIYQGGTLLSCLFIGGSGKATTKLPAGTYMIKDGVGTQWFGVKEAFGRAGDYSTMTFSNNGSQTVSLKSGHAYTITINAAEADPNADSVGSQYESWEGFSEP